MTNSEKKTESTSRPSVSTMGGKEPVPLLPSLQLAFSPEPPLNRSKQRHSEHYAACQGLPSPRTAQTQLIRSRSFDSPSPTLLHIRERCSVKNLLCETSKTPPCQSPHRGPNYHHLNVSVSLSGFSPEPQHSSADASTTAAPPRPCCNRPLYSLTVKLLDFYTSIQQQPRMAYPPKEVPDLQYDNENFEYKIRYGEIFQERYRVLGPLGKGTFGQVVKCHDMTNDTVVALKVVKSHSTYTQQAKHEIDILLDINQDDEHDEYGLVRLLDHFEHRKHLCLVFELLSFNLYELIKKSKSLSLNLIRKIAYQLLNSLHFLSEAGVNIIHSDLKPENILLRDPNRSGVKIIDFGSSCRQNEQIFTYVQSRFYRAPEILLGLDYTQAIDMWSLGCILMELHLGVPLFPGRDSPDQMMKIVQLTGIPPQSMLNRSHNLGQYFQVNSSGQYQLGAHLTQPDARPLDLESLIADSAAAAKWRGTEGHLPENYQRFLDLVMQLLRCDPNDRVTPMAALYHPFFTEEHNWCDIGTVSSKSTLAASSCKKRRGYSFIVSSDATRSPKKIRKHSNLTL